MTKHRRYGLSLVEVLIALAVLGIGIVSLVQLQGNALRFTASAEQIRTVTQVAESELEWRRRTTVADPNCVTFRPDWIETCTVTRTPIGTNAFEIAVSVVGRQASVQLSSFQTGQTYVGGIVNQVSIPIPPSEPSEPSDPTDPADPVDPTDPTEPEDPLPPPPAPCVNPQGREIPCPRN